MKKVVYIVGTVIIIFGAGYAMAQPNYQVDVAGTIDKDYITEATIVPGQHISFAMYLADAVAPQNAGGMWIASQTQAISFLMWMHIEL